MVKWYLVKKFNYRGKELEELQKIPNDQLLNLFTARQRRSLKRVINDEKRELSNEIKESKGDKTKSPIRTHKRDLIILPYMVGATVNTFSGKEFTPVTIIPEMIGHYLGEYVITNKRVSHGAPGVGASRSSLYVPLKWL